jgi:predicted nucleic acid-binding Zn finger protein
LSRIESAVQSGSVKALLFLPSGHRLWTVVGKDSEYWTDPELGFCSCKDFYFSALTKDEPCYHLKSVHKAMNDSRLVPLEMSDSEYTQMLQALAKDAAGQLLR